MQNGNPNGELQHNDNVVSEHKDDLNLTANLDDDAPQGPPQKKRKLANASSRSTPRPPSPPWKKAGADGPTSFMEGGRRRSARTNAIPLDLQPQSGKRHTRSAQKEYVIKSKPTRTARKDTSPSQRDANGRRSSAKALSFDASWKSPVKQSTKALVSKSYPSKSTLPNGRRERRPSKAVVGHNGLYINGKDDVEGMSGTMDGGKDSSAIKKVPKLRLKVKMPSVDVQHPLHVLRPKKFSSFREWLANETTGHGESDFSSPDAALQEAQLRERIREAGEPGNVLSRDKCSYYLSNPPPKLRPQFFHHDHFIAHVQNFARLLEVERKKHRQTAKLLAQQCADAWRKRNKRPEDILKQQQDEIRQKHRQLIRDLQKQFDLVRSEIEKRKFARWQEEKRLEDQMALNKAIKQSTMLFEKSRGEFADESTDNGEQYGSEIETTDDEPDSSSDVENESNMSTNESESEEDGVEHSDDDAGLTAEQLRLKYAHLTVPNTPAAVPDGELEYTGSRISTANVAESSGAKSPSPDPLEGYDVNLDEVDPLLMDDSDDTTDMEDDMGDSDGDTGGGEGDDDSSDDGLGLLGFFSAKEVADFQGVDAGEEQLPIELAEGDGMKVDNKSEEEEDDDDEVLLVPNGLEEQDESGWDSVQETAEKLVKPLSPTQTNGEADQDSRTEMDHIVDSFDHVVETRGSQNLIRQPTDLPSPVESMAPTTKHPTPVQAASPVGEAETPASDVAPEEEPTASPTLKTPIPHLLRGTLREYQHYGLDWLAGLYTSNINGILADEMGLGKTIQTIALLAHLAVEHEVWGPHLVVVPTSVMLNWEMEFKKWCPGFKILTYYGTQDERRQKRKGWMDDNRWHVCITSYQLVLQDQQIFRRRNWHYMILDEAHNIKNFRSQRWQTLLTFKTQARLLLTGTPLQNNLTELWSLLFFLMPSDGNSSGMDGFADLRDFSEWFRRPVEQILEHGRDIMDDEAKKVVTKLHTVLRPYILRRLKADVEKQMPAKFEHVVPCRLSKRQRYLYDGFMSRAQTKETLASGNYLSIINCLMQLRKVCNHPDLFETRPITTSFAMSKSALVDFEIKDLLVRRRLLEDDQLSRVDLDFLNLAPVSREETSKRLVDDSIRIMAYNPLRILRERQYNRTNWNMGFDGSTVESTLMSMDNEARKTRMEELERCLYFESKRHGRRPVYGKSLIELLTLPITLHQQFQRPLQRRKLVQWFSAQSPALRSMILSIEERSRVMELLIQKFACITPAVVARDVTASALTPIESRYFTPEQRVPSYDPFHEPQTRLSIAFPDKRLLQYDCGKLQQLDKLLRQLQAGGHRALIFTQMTKMLDILEQFLNIHGHRYLRLDGATKIEQRQILTERFNNDTRILAFILSSRSGGLGINLTGADTVIFYDLDWNPAMDKQCQDRCHRIGQTRDVHIYRFVSEYTIESNILRKANQKRMLDDVVIQEGEFTTDYFQKLDVRDMLTDDLIEGRDEAAAAMDRVLDTRTGGATRVFEQAEDKEDFDAAKTAENELEHVDDADFAEGSVANTPGPNTPGHPGTSEVNTPRVTEVGEEEQQPIAVKPDEEVPGRPGYLAPEDGEAGVGHIDDYLLRFMEWNLKDEPLALLQDKKKSKRGKEHRLRRHR